MQGKDTDMATTNPAEIAVDQVVKWIDLYIGELTALEEAATGGPADSLLHIQGEKVAASTIRLALESRAYLLDLACSVSDGVQ